MPNRPVSKLSVIFAIIHRKTVGDVVNPKISNNPIFCFLCNSLILKIAKIKVMKERTGITIIPAIPKVVRLRPIGNSSEAKVKSRK